MNKWTKEQNDAIYSKWRDENKTLSSNILVNAAAGSGKTAVLVERIINKLSQEPTSADYCDVRNILVVTFTNAAAKEMSQRVLDALNQKYTDAMSSNDFVLAERLKEQIKHLHQADITTIDSFCLKTVKNYFHLLDIDPDFRIAENGECELLKDEVIDELFDEQYSNHEFIELACMLTDGRDTDEIAELIKALYRFTRSLATPDEWLNEKKNSVCIDNENNIYFDIVKNDVLNKLSVSVSLLKKALKTMVLLALNISRELSDKDFYDILQKNPPESENDIYLAFGTYYTAIYNEYFFARELINKSWDEMYLALQNLAYINLRTSPCFRDKSKEIKDKDILSELKSARDLSKKNIEKIQTIISEPTSEIYRISKEFIYPMVSKIVDLCKDFHEKYSQRKRKINAYEFNDIEHMCLKLIRENSDVRNALKEKYKEILIDEYQDTNGLQEEIFSGISSGDNFFMVGDMKQSIYRFRNSDPGIFKEKNDSYSTNKKDENFKIVLSKNFRSRKIVLDSINSVFRAVMSEKVGEIDYDEDQQLYSGNSDYIDKNDNYKSECCVILKRDEDDISTDELDEIETEARYIAKKIKELKDNGFLVCDKKTIKNFDGNGKLCEEKITYYRPIQNKDIAILVSSHKNISAIYQKELSNLGIDCYAEVNGYFDKNEITMAISLLKTINNPYNDLPLIAVLRSPIFSFSDDELCEIRLCGGDRFYDSLKIAGKNVEFAGYHKCNTAIKKLDKWRRYKKVMSCDKLLWTLYQETGIYSFCESVYGEDAALNLRLLFVRAKNFEKSGYKGLFNFIRYIGKIQKREEDLSSAVTLGENSDVVRLMTIHKSKGLEFPVVFLASCSKGFNMTDTRKKVLFHKDLGFGVNYINYNENYFDKTIQKKALAIKIDNETISEEMRKLYVALTRAKEKLFVTAVCKKKNSSEFEDELPADYEKWLSLLEKNDKFSYNDAISAGKYINWIAPVSIKDSDNWVFNIIPYCEASKIDAQFFPDISFESDTENDIVISNKEYEFEKATNIPTKISVTDIKRLFGNSVSELVKRPVFLSETSALTATERGTAVHYIMQKFIPDNDVDYEKVVSFINQLVSNDELAQQEADSVNPQMIVDFYQSEIGKRILKSDRVYREVSFEIEVDLDEIMHIESNEKIILQGVIDCYFYEGDDIVLVDYKTDNYVNKDEIKEKYSQQLQLYKLAIEKITSKLVKNQILYLFSTKSVIQYI